MGVLEGAMPLLVSGRVSAVFGVCPSTVLEVFLGYCSLGRVVKADASIPSNQKI